MHPVRPSRHRWLRVAPWLGVLGGLALSASALAADVCKWKDEAGRPQFGDCRLAPAAQGAKVDVRPANPDTVSRPGGVTPAAVDPQRLRSLRPPVGDLPPLGTPAPAAWTQACENIAQRLMRQPQGTPFQAEAREIQQSCPGYAYRCEFDHDRPQTNRCGPVKSLDGEFSIGNVHRGFPRDAKLPTIRDLASKST